MADGSALRRSYRRQMLRIQCESMLQREPIFTTLGKTSVLADSVIAAAYRIALTEAAPPASADYRPSDQMIVISLGAGSFVVSRRPPAKTNLSIWCFAESPNSGMVGRW